MSFIGCILILACLPSALLDFAIPKWKSDTNTRIDDAYKYLFQATRGGEHAAPTKEEAKKWLDNEWQSLSAGMPNEMVWEPLCPGGEIGRMNLRPFRDQGGRSEDLLDAFLASASEFKTEAGQFNEAWTELGRRLSKKKIGKTDHKAWKKLDAEMSKKDYPAIHHSEQYNKANRPAYRVLTRDQAKRLMPVLP